MNSKKFLYIRIILISLSFLGLISIELYQRKIIKQEEQRVIEESKKVTDQTIIDASKLYITNNQDFYSELLKYDDFEIRINTDDLVKSKLIDNNDNFKGYVSVINNDFNYVHENEILYNKMNSKDYYANSNNDKEPYDLKYYYKGEDPNNYIKYNNRIYRIIGITNSLDLKVISMENSIEETWGLSGNINYLKKEMEQTEDGYKGVFYVGFIRSETKDVNSIMKNEKRNNTYTVGTPKYVGTYSYVNVSDIVNSSSNCKYDNITNINSNTCPSYLINMLSNTFTSNSLENNLVYKINENKEVITSKIDKNINIKKVFYISGLEEYKSGNGTKENPYEIN